MLNSETELLGLWLKDRNRIIDGRGEKLQFLELTLDTPEKRRMADHLRAQAAFYKGDIALAASLLRDSMEQNGENIECLKDLACCYYQLGDIHSWRKSYEKLVLNLERLASRLSLRTQLECWICVAKFMEEEGHVMEALEIYRRYYNHLRHETENPQYTRLLSQLVRIEASTDTLKDLGQLYSNLVRLKGADLIADFNVEIQHSLMLAELHLVGPDHAWIRVNAVINSENTMQLDKSLILYDFVETCLLEEISLSPAATAAVTKFSGEGRFEAEVRRLVFNPSDIQIEHLSLLSSEMSLACYLRLLMLWLRLNPEKKEAKEIKNKIQLILSSFKADSKNYWQERIRFALGQTEVRLNFDPLSRKLTAGGKAVDLSKKKGMQTLVQKLTEKPQQTIDDMINALWGTDFTPEHYHRLRMTVHRLNTLISEIIPLQKSIEVSSERVALKPEVRLSLADKWSETEVDSFSRRVSVAPGLV